MTVPQTICLAFGSNINSAQMRHRCPLAYALGRVTLPNWRLVFRHYADIERCDGDRVQGVLYRLTPRCEATLDHYEGVAKGSYRKAYLTIQTRTRGEVRALVYRKCRGAVELPPAWYLQTIAAGYREHGMPLAGLKAAVARAAAAACEADAEPEFDFDQRRGGSAA